MFSVSWKAIYLLYAFVVFHSVLARVSAGNDWHCFMDFIRALMTYRNSGLLYVDSTLVCLINAHSHTYLSPEQERQQSADEQVSLSSVFFRRLLYFWIQICPTMTECSWMGAFLVRKADTDPK